MIERYIIDKLSYNETEELVQFFLNRMDQEERQELIATHPVSYAKLYPQVHAELIAEKVRARVQEMRDQR